MLSIVNLITEGHVDNANIDHNFVLNKVIARRDNQYTPYLFSVYQLVGKRFYTIVAENTDLNKDYLTEASFECAPVFSSTELRDGIAVFMRVTPAIKKRFNEIKKGRYSRLIPIRDCNEIKHWFVLKMASNDYDVDHVNVLEHTKIVSTQGNRTLNQAYLSFVIKASTNEKLLQLLQGGIGKCKGYGFGMPIYQNTLAFNVFTRYLTTPSLTSFNTQ